MATPDRPDATVPADRIALDQTFHARDLFALRSAVGAHGSALGLSGPRVADLILVAHELAANAVRHAGADERTPGRLRLWRDGDEVCCEVTDLGPGFRDAERAGRRPVPIAANGGRGLWIIRQVASRLSIDTSARGTTITVSLTLA